MSLIEFIYDTGDAFLPENLKQLLSKNIVGTKSYLYLDGWSAVHFISGILAGFVFTKLSKKHIPLTDYYFSLFIFHTIWEMWQVAIGMSKTWVLFGHNAFMDTVFDTLCFLFGTFVYKNIFL